MDDDDEYLYGESLRDEHPTTSEPKPISYEKIQGSNGLITHLEEEAEATSISIIPKDDGTRDINGGDYGEEEDAGSEEESDDDVEIIMEPVARSLDFRGQNRPPPTSRAGPSALPSNLPTAPRAAGLSLTTEYTPISRGGQPQPSLPSTDIKSHLAQQDSSSVGPNAHIPAITSREPDDGIDTSLLPPAHAPPSAPSVDLNVVGTFDGRSILEVDLSAMAEKPWRRPGSDISDWFNYGFDELSWEAYCVRRRDLGELANVLKTNIINFSALQEDQLLALPPDVRTMVMTGASAMMNNAANQGMMAPGVMMDMGMIGAMGSMGLNGDMAAAIGGQMMQGMMPPDGGAQGGQQAGPGAAVSQEVGMMQDSAFNPAHAAAGSGMMNIGMGGDYVIQEQNPMVQQMYPVMDTQNVQPGMQGGRGAPPPFRGRGVPSGGLGRGGRGFTPRGRGRGGIYGSEAPVVAPVRPASPLPPNVPTGPRNQNKYKDRDGNAPAVDGLDYGGGLMGRRTPSGEPEERILSRKRRSSPGLDDIRGSKRR
jgi:pre-mRNA 3'-end-processing factor FIP1